MKFITHILVSHFLMVICRVGESNGTTEGIDCLPRNYWPKIQAESDRADLQAFSKVEWLGRDLYQLSKSADQDWPVSICLLLLPTSSCCYFHLHLCCEIFVYLLQVPPALILFNFPLSIVLLFKNPQTNMNKQQVLSQHLCYLITYNNQPLQLYLITLNY